MRLHELFATILLQIVLRALQTSSLENAKTQNKRQNYTKTYSAKYCDPNSSCWPNNTIWQNELGTKLSEKAILKKWFISEYDRCENLGLRYSKFQWPWVLSWGDG